MIIPTKIDKHGNKSPDIPEGFQGTVTYDYEIDAYRAEPDKDAQILEMQKRMADMEMLIKQIAEKLNT